MRQSMIPPCTAAKGTPNPLDSESRSFVAPSTFPSLSLAPWFRQETPSEEVRFYNRQAARLNDTGHFARFDAPRHAPARHGRGRMPRPSISNILTRGQKPHTGQTKPKRDKTPQSLRTQIINTPTKTVSLENERDSFFKQH